MNLRQMKNNICLGGTRELHQFCNRCRIIQVTESFCNKFPGNFNTGVTVQRIIIAKIIFIQQEIHLFTAVAAKGFIVGNDRAVARIAAVITR